MNETVIKKKQLFSGIRDLNISFSQHSQSKKLGTLTPNKANIYSALHYGGSTNLFSTLGVVKKLKIDTMGS